MTLHFKKMRSKIIIQLTTNTMTLSKLTQSELKDLVAKSRKQITSINGVQFNENYPMLDVSNKHAYYYDVETQGNKFIYSPFIVTTNGN